MLGGFFLSQALPGLEHSGSSFGFLCVRRAQSAGSCLEQEAVSRELGILHQFPGEAHDAEMITVLPLSTFTAF